MALGLSPATINLRLSPLRKLAREMADKRAERQNRAKPEFKSFIYSNMGK
jgi:hypothetical protein